MKRYQTSPINRNTHTEKLTHVKIATTKTTKDNDDKTGNLLYTVCGNVNY